MKADDIILLISKELGKEKEKLDICRQYAIEFVSCATSEDYCYQRGRVDVLEGILNEIKSNQY